MAHDDLSRGLLPGDVVADRLVIERLAGAGGMGAIYCAKDLLTQERVVVKVMVRYVVSPSSVALARRFPSRTRAASCNATSSPAICSS